MLKCQLIFLIYSECLEENWNSLYDRYTVIPTIQASHKVIHLKSLTVRFPHLWKCNYKNQIEIPPKSSWWHWSKLTFPVSAPAMYFPSSCSHCSLCSLPDKSQPPQTSIYPLILSYFTYIQLFIAIITYVCISSYYIDIPSSIYLTKFQFCINLTV